MDALGKILDHLGDACPPRVRGWAQAYYDAPPERQPLILAAIATVEPALRHLSPGGLPEGGSPYPRAPQETQARLILGETPAQISGGLTRREAHRWLTEAPLDTPADWLLAECEIPAWDEGHEWIQVHTVRVARWLIDRWRQPDQRAALLAERREMLAGQEIGGTYLSRVDELRDRDLRPSVIDTYRRATARLQRQIERALQSRGEPLRAPPRWWRPVSCARLLLSAADLVAEGRALKHCVASYAEAVRSGRSVIIGLCVLGQRSTIEVTPDGQRITQHVGRANSAPPELCQRAAAKLIARWRVAGGSR